jgi:hypothetical protein
MLIGYNMRKRNIKVVFVKNNYAWAHNTVHYTNVNAAKLALIQRI